jgi:hypothetical protein
MTYTVDLTGYDVAKLIGADEALVASATEKHITILYANSALKLVRGPTILWSMPLKPIVLVLAQHGTLGPASRKVFKDKIDAGISDAVKGAS